MNEKYFNKWEFQKAISLIETDPYRAKQVLEEYLKEYPKDYSMVTYYISNLITLGLFDDAKLEFDKLENDIRSDKQFLNQKDKINSLKLNCIFVKLKLLSYLEKYDEMYKILKSYPNEIGKLDVNTLSFYCKHQVGKLDKSKKNYNSYLFRQITEYSEEEYKEHIKKHLADYNADLDDPNSNVFNSSFPHEEVLEEIKKYIPSDKRLYSGIFENVYIFKYDCCGRANNKIVDYFKVVCFHNTKNIITVCPVADAQNLPCIDLNYMIKNVKNNKVSQIDKFNKRFKRN